MKLFGRTGITALAAALLLGAAIGITVQLPVKVVQVPCSVDGLSPGTIPCPPDSDRVVWAAWDGGLRTPASWNGTRWTFARPVMGQHDTTHHPIAWTELDQGQERTSYAD